MCKLKSEGGLRCASHTRPAYVTALREQMESDTLESSEETLRKAAEAYCSTPSGYSAVENEIERLETSGNLDTAAVLRTARERGHAQYLADKEATRLIQQEALRSEVVRWARAVPESDLATDEYHALVARDLDVDPASVPLALAEHSPTHLNDGAPVRFITIGSDGGHVGTQTNPAALGLIEAAERLAAQSRRDKRERLEPENETGERVVRYENDELSEVLHTVRYSPESRTLSVTLRDKRSGQPSTSPAYTYTHVSPSLFNALTSARSMGRFYSYVFSRVPNGGSLAGASDREYAFAVHAANSMSPLYPAAGPVPVKTPSNLKP
jgi:hypothetical protein